MIVEHFFESLVLLKHHMCWELKDLLFFSCGVAEYPYRALRDSALEAVHRRISAVDYALYQHFNESLWRRIRAMPTSFFREVRQLRLLHRRTASYCGKLARRPGMRP